MLLPSVTATPAIPVPLLSTFPLSVMLPISFFTGAAKLAASANAGGTVSKAPAKLKFLRKLLLSIVIFL